MARTQQDSGQNAHDVHSKKHRRDPSGPLSNVDQAAATLRLPGSHAPSSSSIPGLQIRMYKRPRTEPERTFQNNSGLRSLQKAKEVGVDLINTTSAPQNSQALGQQATRESSSPHQLQSLSRLSSVSHLVSNTPADLVTSSPTTHLPLEYADIRQDHMHPQLLIDPESSESDSMCASSSHGPNSLPADVFVPINKISSSQPLASYASCGNPSPQEHINPPTTMVSASEPEESVDRQASCDALARSIELRKTRLEVMEEVCNDYKGKKYALENWIKHWRGARAGARVGFDEHKGVKRGGGVHFGNSMGKASLDTEDDTFNEADSTTSEDSMTKEVEEDLGTRVEGRMSVTVPSPIERQLSQPLISLAERLGIDSVSPFNTAIPPIPDITEQDQQLLQVLCHVDRVEKWYAVSHILELAMGNIIDPKQCRARAAQLLHRYRVFKEQQQHEIAERFDFDVVGEDDAESSSVSPQNQPSYTQTSESTPVGAPISSQTSPYPLAWMEAQERYH